MTMQKTKRCFLICMACLATVAWDDGAAASGPDVYRRARTGASSLADQLVIRARMILKTQGEIVDHQYRRARVLLDLAMDLAPNDPYIMRMRYELARETEPHASQLQALRNYLKVVRDDDALQLEYVRLLVEQEERMDDRVRRVEHILASPSADSLTKSLRSRLASFCANGAREEGDMKRFRDHLAVALHLDPTNAEAAIMMFENVSAGPPDLMRRGAALLWMMRAQPMAVEPRRALGEMLLGHGVFAASALQFRGVQSSAGVRLDDQFYHDWAIALASQGDVGSTMGALRVLSQFGPVRHGADQADEEEEKEQSPAGGSGEDEEAEVQASRVPLDLELIRVALMHSTGRMPAETDASYQRIIRVLDAMHGEDGSAEIDKALLTARLGRSDLTEEMINELEVEFGTDNLAIQRMHGWLELHAGNVESSRSIFRSVIGENSADAYAIYGLAETYRQDYPGTLHVEYLQELVTRWPGTLPAMLAARDLHEKEIDSSVSPEGSRLQTMIDEMPLDLRLPDLGEREWTSLRLDIPQKRYGLFDPIFATLYLRNTSDIPLAIGTSGALPARVFVVISLRIAGRHMGTMPAIVVDMKRRLTLAQGEEMSVKIRLDHSAFGRVLRSNITDVIEFDAKAILDPVPLPDGGIGIGLLGAEASTHHMQRWGQPFDSEDVGKWLAVLDDPNELRQLEAYAWLGNTAYWLIASAKNGRKTVERIVAKQEREAEEEEDLLDDVEAVGSRGAIELDESSEVTTEQIENMEQVITRYEGFSHQISDAYIERYERLDPVRQAWVLLFLPPTSEVKAQFGPLYTTASESNEALTRVVYLATAGLRPGDEAVDAAVESLDSKIRDFAEALNDIFAQLKQGS